MEPSGLVKTVTKGAAKLPCVMLDVSGFTVDALAMSTDAPLAFHTAHATGFRHRGGNFCADALPHVIRPKVAFDRSCHSIIVRRETYRVQRCNALPALGAVEQDRDILSDPVTSTT